MAATILKRKSDADILTDIQTLALNITGFTFIDGDAKVTFDGELSSMQKSRLKKYFKTGDDCEWNAS